MRGGRYNRRRLAAFGLRARSEGTRICLLRPAGRSSPCRQRGPLREGGEMAAELTGRQGPSEAVGEVWASSPAEPRGAAGLEGELLGQPWGRAEPLSIVFQVIRAFSISSPQGWTSLAWPGSG